MEERYLFKGKTSNESWVHGSLSRSGDKKKWYISNKAGAPFAYEVKPETVCQCTGVKDRNDILIWENDIVHMRTKGLSGYGKVIYRDGCYWVDDKKRNRQYPFSNHDVAYRVDGNAFDNPELTTL